MVLTELLKARGMESAGIFDVPTVALVFGVHRVTVRRFIREGKLPAIRRGRVIIGVTFTALAEYLEAGNEGSK